MKRAVLTATTKILRCARTALIAAGALLLASCLVAPRHEDVGVGKELPAFDLPSLAGGDVSSASYLGEPVVLNFWATWCGPCLKEVPTLKAIHRDSPARVVTIAIDEEGESIIRPFVEKHGIDYPVLIGDTDLFRRYNGSAVPYTLVLDASFKIVSMHRGYVSMRTIERDLRRAAS